MRSASRAGLNTQETERGMRKEQFLGAHHRIISLPPALRTQTHSRFAMSPRCALAHLALALALLLAAPPGASAAGGNSSSAAARAALRQFKLAAAAAAADADPRGGRELQSCSAYTSCGSCAGSSSCGWCMSTNQCLSALSTACPSSSAFMPGDCNCPSLSSSCTSCTGYKGGDCIYCDATRACTPVFGGSCGSYSIIPDQCSGLVPKSSQGACQGHGSCASCTSVPNLCAYCTSSPSVGCLDAEHFPYCTGSGLVATGCGGSISVSSGTSAVASAAVSRGIGIAVAILIASIGVCYRYRARLCRGGRMRPRSGAGVAGGAQAPVVVQSPYPGQQSYSPSSIQQPQPQVQSQPSPYGGSGGGGAKPPPPPRGAPAPFAIVKSVTPGSPADLAGLRAGDGLVSLCGARSFDAVGACLAQCEAQRAAPPSEVLRGGASFALFISPHLGERWAGRLGAVIDEPR